MGHSRNYVLEAGAEGAWGSGTLSRAKPQAPAPPTSSREDGVGTTFSKPPRPPPLRLPRGQSPPAPCLQSSLTPFVKSLGGDWGACSLCPFAHQDVFFECSIWAYSLIG